VSRAIRIAAVLVACLAIGVAVLAASPETTRLAGDRGLIDGRG
jgi:hypothetical protein